MKLSIKGLAELTGKTRETIAKKVKDLPFVDEYEGKAGKFYDSIVALETLYGTNDKPGMITAQDAQRELAVARTAEIELGMECTRRERIPLEDVHAVYDETLGNISALMKRHVGQVLTVESVNDMFAEIRSIAEKLEQLK